MGRFPFARRTPATTGVLTHPIMRIPIEGFPD